MPADYFVSVLMLEVERLCEMSEMYSPQQTSLYTDLGNAVCKKYYGYIKSFRDRNDKVTEELSLCELYKHTCICS